MTRRGRQSRWATTLALNAVQAMGCTGGTERVFK